MHETVSSRLLVQYWANRLARKKWQFFATLHFRRRSIPFWMAERCFDDWILEIDGDREDGCIWWRANELSAFPDSPVFHALVGRLVTDHSSVPLIGSWWVIAGDAHIERCSHGNISESVAEIARLGSEFKVAYDL